MQKTSTVTVPFMLLGILFNICLVASNLLETKVIQVFGITATAGLIVSRSHISSMTVSPKYGDSRRHA